MRSISFLLVILLLAASLDANAPVAQAADPTTDELVKAFEADLESDDSDVRARAFDRLHLARDPAVVGVIVKSLQAIKKQTVKIRREQETIEAKYEKQFERKLDADEAFENSSRSSRELDAYNKKVRKITKDLDKLRLKQKSLENDFTRARAQLDGAVTAVGKVLDNIPEDALPAALDRLASGWLESSDPEDRVRWVDAIADLDRPGVAERIRREVANLERDVKVRAAALETLGARKDKEALDYATANLVEGVPWDMQAAAISAMALLREKECVEPLMLYLKRDDIKRLREDAHVALKSLTGEEHGPYYDPWQRWWRDAKDGFQIPKDPPKRGARGAAEEGSTFYGIHTFSDRILYILDISGSMDQAPKGKDEAGNVIATGPPKMDTAKKELTGSIISLDEGGLFNVIFFNHEVVPWQNKMVQVTESQKRRAVKWVESQTPLGTTNIHDALERGFAIALRATGTPLIDTIFFLTDGRPTSGKIQDSERILREVLDWNKSARLKIHTIGIGDHDAKLLQALATATGGEYIAK